MPASDFWWLMMNYLYLSYSWEENKALSYARAQDQALGSVLLAEGEKNRLRVPRDAVTDLTFSEHMHKKDGGWRAEF